MPKPPSELPDHQVTPNPKLKKRVMGLFRFVWNISLQPFSVMASGTGLLADA